MLLKQIEIKVAWRLKRGNAFKRKLLAEGKTRWLDIGSGNNFDEGFFSLDWLPHEDLPPELAKRYYRANILEMTSEDYEKLGKFDLIRMQHVLEHFGLEDGFKALQACAKLLNCGGYLLVTVPDLRINAKSYLRNSYQKQRFARFARQRIPEDAPSSFYFSMFAHSFAHSPIDDTDRAHRDQHKWCYDFEGVKYQLMKVDAFSDIKKLGLLDRDAYIPFTHNRPEEDVCILARHR